MKTDTIFYQLFQSFSSIFFELIQLPITEAKAWVENGFLGETRFLFLGETRFLCVTQRI